MKVQADKHKSNVQFAKGDLVFIKLPPYKQVSLFGSFHKLSKRFYGPFNIFRKFKGAIYELDLLPHTKIHNIFHVSSLKPSYGNVILSLELLAHTFHNNLVLVLWTLWILMW